MYLMIQNKGVAPVEAFTLLGASTSRDDDRAIGQFGTGTKHSINLLLRKSLHHRICCGKTRLDFQTEIHTMDDGLVEKDMWKVFCQFTGDKRKRIDVGWVLDFGALDWDDVGMALREFISNAIDRTVREFGDFRSHIDSGDLCVKIVDDNQVKARDGYTRVFIKLDDEGEIMRYVSELPKRFLHFSKSRDSLDMQILPKSGRNLSEGGTAMIYREGVFVREIKETTEESVFDYNFRGDQIEIDDSRNSTEYAIRAACSRLIRDAKANQLVPLLSALLHGKKTFEGVLDPYYLKQSGYATEGTKEKQQAEWQAAWEMAAEGAIAAKPGVSHAKEYAKRKGHDVSVIPEAWVDVVASYGIPTTDDVLNENEKKGREIVDATPAAQKALDRIWDWCEMTGLTNGKDKPGIKCYHELSSDGECQVLGFYRLGETDVHVRHDIASDGVNKMLLNTTLEEVAHYITGATDNSRDFQNFFLDMIVELID